MVSAGLLDLIQKQVPEIDHLIDEFNKKVGISR